MFAGFKMRILPPYPYWRRKRLTEMGWFLQMTIKRVDKCRCLDRYVKEPYEMSLA